MDDGFLPAAERTPARASGDSEQAPRSASPLESAEKKAEAIALLTQLKEILEVA